VIFQFTNHKYWLHVVDVDSPCSEFDGGTPLHIAARNLSLETAKVLLANGSYPFAVDLNGRMPLGKSLMNGLFCICCHCRKHALVTVVIFY